MNTALRNVLCAALATLFFANAQAQTNFVSIQTNLDYWVQTLNVALTATTNGAPSTNGIVRNVRTGAMRISSKDLITEFYNSQVFAISKALATNVFVTTNVVSKTNVITTNAIVFAYPVLQPVTNASYSATARLLVKQPLGTNGLSSLIVIRDGRPAMDFVVSNYFRILPVSFDARTNNAIALGKFDIVHGLASVTETSVEEFIFDQNAFAGFPPLRTHLDAQGLMTRQESSLVEQSILLADRVTRSSVWTLTGTGQVGSTTNYAILKGTISTSGGKLERQ